jgi:hypothetical protein
MALILVIVAVARNQYLSSLSPSRSRPANAAVIDTVSSSLRETVRIVLIVSALVALGAVIAGNSRFRGWLANKDGPSWMTEGPVHSFAVAHRKGLQWGVLVVGLIVVVVWNNPTALVAVVVVLVTLGVVGLVGLFARTRHRPQAGVPSPHEGGGAAAVGTGGADKE